MNEFEKELDGFLDGNPEEPAETQAESAAETAAESMAMEPAITAAETAAETAAITMAESAATSGVVAPVETAVVSAAETDEVTQLKARLEAYQEMVVGTPAVAPAESAAVSAAVLEYMEQAFVADEAALDEALKTPENFNSFLNKSFKAFMEANSQGLTRGAVNTALLELPNVTAEVVKGQLNLYNLVKDFYAENEDLSRHREYVGMISNKLASENPTWTTAQLLQETEKEVRDKLRIVKGAIAAPAVTPAVPGSSPPAFVNPGGARVNASEGPQLTALEKDVADIIDGDF